jgi:glycerol-3-phosphate dehydrogenase
MVKQIEADVVVIGSGITGTSIARELSRYKVETILVEKAGYISAGQTKASAGGIYTESLRMVRSLVVKSAYAAGAPLYDAESRKLKFIREGFKMWHQLLEELDVRVRSEPVLIVAVNKKELADLENYVRVGESIGGRYADMRWVDKETILAMVPYMTNDVVAGLYSDTRAMQTLPWELAIAMADNAKQNGVRVVLDAEVTGISQKDGYQLVETTQGPIKTRFIVNAAGVNADVVADMGGAHDWGLVYIRHLFLVLDRRLGQYVNLGFTGVGVPGEMDGFALTPEGNIVVIAVRNTPTQDKYAFGSHRLEHILAMRVAKQYLPKVSEKDVIRTYVPLTAFNTRDPEENIVEPCSTNPRFINVAVRMPGIAPSPAIAKYVVELLGDAGLELTTRSDFNPFRTAIPRFRDLSDSERNKLIAQDPRYGHVVCRCETVTEGEIVEAIKRGARTVTGIKYMTRAGMGRCQGGFCGPRVVGILARELGIPVTQVMDSSPGSPIVPFGSKELLREATKVRA